MNKSLFSKTVFNFPFVLKIFKLTRYQIFKLSIFAVARKSAC
jgi:hypothetical protein